MSLKIKIISSVTFILIFILGVLFDRIWKYYSFISFNGEINIMDVANLIVSIFIAIMIPVFITKLLADRRGIKTIIGNDIEELISIIKDIRNIVTKSHDSNNFTDKDRDKINYYFHIAELKAFSIIQQVEKSFKGEKNNFEEKITNCLFRYNHFLTGGELMHSSFKKVDLSFCRENETNYYKIETSLKSLIHEVCKY